MNAPITTVTGERDSARTELAAAATARALQDAELRKRWIDQGYVIWNGKASDLAERMRREHALWAEVTKGMAFE